MTRHARGVLLFLERFAVFIAKMLLIRKQCALYRVSVGKPGQYLESREQKFKLFKRGEVKKRHFQSFFRYPISDCRNFPRKRLRDCGKRAKRNVVFFQLYERNAVRVGYCL